MSNRKEPTGKWVTEEQLIEALTVFRREHLTHDHVWRRMWRKLYSWILRADVQGV